MKVVNLHQTSDHFVKAQINKHVGGKSIESYWIAGFQKGIGGFSFMDPESDKENEKYKVSIAFFTSGIGIYCRNLFSNYLVLIPESELTNLHIIKETDIICPFAFSPYTVLKRFGISDHTASKYLMPKEIITEHQASFVIKTSEKFFKLHLEKIHPDKLISILKRTNFVHIMNVDIQSPQIIG
ncbi:MAG: hypothetical protein IPO92_03525 [Saprospiraceae bacterium]|nr:hypothetical protein [Saprospiraceae bacterium]